MNHRIALLGAALLGLTGVAAGAFGAHALRPFLDQRGMLEVWQTAAHYQLVHAAGLVGLATWIRGANSGRWSRRTAWLWIAGVVLFSGSLYLIATGAPRWVGPITPLGGALLLLGWLFLVFEAWTGASSP